MRNVKRNSLDLIRFYGLLGSLRLARDLIVTVLFFRGARLIRWPWYIRGRGGISFGLGLTTGVGARLEVLGSVDRIKLIFGSNVQIGDYVHIGVFKQVHIEDDVLIGSKVLIIDHNHGDYSGFSSEDPNVVQVQKSLVGQPVSIGRNVWIGDSVSILAGVRIGENSIIAANSLVINEIPPNCIAGGNPARIIKLLR